VYVIVGSCGGDVSDSNPFNSIQRMFMINTCVVKYKIKNIDIRCMPDIAGDDPAYVKQFDKFFYPAGGGYEAIYSGNPWVLRIFAAEGYDVHRLQCFRGIHATDIRNVLEANEGGSWKSKVPKCIWDQVGNMYKR